MKSFKSVLALATVVALSAGIATSVFAEGGKACSKGKHGEGMHQKMAEKLNLSEEQQAKMKILHEEFRASHEAELEAMHSKWKEYKEMKDSGASEAELSAKKEAIKAEFSSLHDDKMAMKEKMKTILTPEQQAKAEEMKAEWKSKKGKKGEGHGKRHGHGHDKGAADAEQ